MAASLPVEVVSHIMRFLSVSDRKEVSLVCRRWYEASLDPILQKDIIIHFYASTSTEQAIPGMSRRKMPNLVFNHFDTSLDAKSILLKSSQHLARDLKSLSLKGSNITESTLVELLSNCPNLVRLDLSCCNSLFMSGKLLEKNSDIQNLKKVLKNVKDLNLSAIRYLSDATFNRIVTICLNVEKLALASTQLTFHSRAYYPSDTTKCISGSVFTFQNVLDYISSQAEKLVSLNFSKTQMTDETLEQIACIGELKLKEIILVGCRNISDAGIVRLGNYQPTLRALDLGECAELDDGAVSVIVNSFLEMRNLRVNKCRLLTDRSVKLLHNLPLIEVLDLSECFQLTSSGLEQAICKNPAVYLTHLNLNCCSALTDKFVEKLCEMVPNLVHLDLGSCFPVTDSSVHAISRSLKHLRYLRLAWCKEVTDLGILGLEVEDNSKHCESHDHGTCKCNRKYHSTEIFRKPTLEKEKKEKAKAREKIENKLKTEDQIYRLYNIAGLRHLDLTACKKLTDTGLSQGLKFKELRSLHLGMLPGLTDEGMVTIATNNPSIEELNLSQCGVLTDISMEAIVRKLPRLQNLNVFGCDKLTDKTINLLTTYCKRLRHLDVSFCSGISYDAVDRLETSLKSLQSVQKRMVGGF